jgi:preprotein translocase subunit SecD
VQTQLVILSLIIVPLMAVATPGCSIDRSSQDRIAVVQNRLLPSKFASQGGTQLTIRLKPTKQHPTISPADRDRVQQVIEGRINGLRIEDAYVKSIGIDRIVVQLPGVKDARQAERVLGGTAQLEFREQKAGTEGQLGAELAVLRETQAQQAVLKQSKSPNKSAISANQAAIEQQYTEIGKLFDRAVISAEHLKNAVAQPVSNLGWEIAIEFDNVGSEAFTRLTKKLAGTGRSIGVFIDNDPITTPTVGPQFAATGITGGKAVITGNFTAENANDLAIQLRSGSLPVPIEIIETRTVPPKSN